jgi:hypothetical protein
MMVIFLCGLVALILMRTLRQDYAKVRSVPLTVDTLLTFPSPIVVCVCVACATLRTAALCFLPIPLCVPRPPPFARHHAVHA